MRSLQLHTGPGCSLAIGRYPPFRYDARGGGGPGVLHEAAADGWQLLSFDPLQLDIPPLNSRTTRFLGLPLPAGLAITITAQQLAGRWQRHSGAVELAFQARFRFSLGPWYSAPDLLVRTQLVTGVARGDRHQAEGRPLDARGQGRLVGVACVPPSGERWLDRFLGLPDGALAVLHCRLQEPHPG